MAYKVDGKDIHARKKKYDIPATVADLEQQKVSIVKTRTRLEEYKYWAGVCLLVAFMSNHHFDSNTIVLCSYYCMVFASTFGSTGAKEWGIAFALSIAQDIFLIEVIIIVVNLLILF